MQKQPTRVLSICIILFLCLTTSSAFAASQAAQYLSEFGATFYRMGKFDDALGEFEKVLMIEPDNQEAKAYIRLIFQKEAAVRAQAQVNPLAKSSIGGAPDVDNVKPSREDAISNTLNQLDSESSYGKKPGTSLNKGIVISGEAMLSLGVTPHDVIWKRANFDLNEEYQSWRRNSTAVFNRGFNTYDPRVYDSLVINADTQNKEGFNFHTNITIDPWSFVGKSDKITVTGSNGDTAQLQLYYWSNTGYVVNDTAYTSSKGDSFGIPEVKVKNGISDGFTSTSYRLGATYDVPAMKIKREFQPLRELWLNYNNDQLKFRAFPMSYQDQAYSSDDPMGITNHGIWWNESKWLRQYTPGNYNSGDTTPSYTKGYWNDALSSLSKDSTGKYLTALRGFSFTIQPQEQVSFDTTIATPKNLWQDYGQVDNIISASRLKYKPKDNFMLGSTFTSRTGFITEKKQELDSRNFVAGVDLGYEIADGIKAQAEALGSKSYYDESNSNYRTQDQGNAYYFSLITRYPRESIMDLKYGYDEIGMKKGETFLTKSKFYAARMDNGFDSALSDFHNTRQDVFWSRHIHFRMPLKYYSSGLYGNRTNWDELNATKIGDGIDIGRNVLGYRFETFLENKFYNLFDVRNVHNVKGKFVENVVRDEATIKVTDKLTAKVLGIYQKLPRTTGGVDPFIYDGVTGDFFLNSAVPDGEDPSIKTGSFGLNYDFFDWLSINGIYERTNDYSLAYGGFPQDVYINNTTLYGTYYQNDKLYRAIQSFLYNQQYYPQAPYPYYNVAKAGLRLAPFKNMEMYIDYAYNEFKAASMNSDGMNHVGFEVAYMPTSKFGMALKYIFSRSQDMDHLLAGDDNMIGHHNFFGEFRYLPSKDDELILQYGEGNSSAIGNMVLDPYGGSMLTLDTQHIFRAYYRRKF
ncbi:MAG: hypothetical protein WC723_03720 [Candidatus Omnitrophota bacterium]